jgi:hypothetical protein
MKDLRGARVLITSRFSDRTKLADLVRLGVPPLQEAISFFLSRSEPDDACGGQVLAEPLGCRSRCRLLKVATHLFA